MWRYDLLNSPVAFLVYDSEINLKECNQKWKKIEINFKIYNFKNQNTFFFKHT